MSYESDVQDLACCGWMEARSDGISGCVAVMHVVMNRVHSLGFPKTVHDVVYQPNAFSWTRLDNPEYGLEPPPNDPVWQACLIDAPNVLEDADDPTGGACYYANEKNIDSGGWYQRHIINSLEHPVTVVLGHHTFRI